MGFGLKKTMMLAQRLYEAGYITYMRTDSTNLSTEAVNDCRKFIESQHGAKYLSAAPISYSNKENAQEAHEAIRPSDVGTLPSHLKNVDRDAERLYTLIWRQFVACQMAPAKFLSTSVVVNHGDYELRTRGRVVVFDGYQKIHPPVSKKEEDGVLPAMKVGEVLELERLKPAQHFTKPPARYTEASLVKELEKRKELAGLRPTLQLLQLFRTVATFTVDRRRFYAQKMGDIVTERLVESFHRPYGLRLYGLYGKSFRRRCPRQVAMARTVG